MAEISLLYLGLQDFDQGLIMPQQVRIVDLSISYLLGDLMCSPGNQGFAKAREAARVSPRKLLRIINLFIAQ
jgi:hypothetical protein